jgi:hypothetical protein
MKWQVTGADRKTGADRTITVDAEDEAQAWRRANREGVLVATATSIAADSPAPPAPPPTIEYRSPSPDSTPIQPSRPLDRVVGGMERFVYGGMNVIGVLLVIVLFLSAAGMILGGSNAGTAFRYDSDTAAFHADNAVGATANRTKEVAREVRTLNGWASIVAGLLAANLGILIVRTVWPRKPLP